MSDSLPTAARWGDDADDLTSVIAAQREIIARLQAERDEQRDTIARLSSQLSAQLRRPVS